MIELSLNEVETLAAKAARGAGFAWGLAEEIGRGAVALAREGRDWSADLLTLLEEAPGGRHCPVLTAAWLNDARPAEALTLRDIGRPVWLKALAPEFEVMTDLEAARADARVAPRPGPRLGGEGERRRAHISQAQLDALGAYAARNYVPESESSRRRGAGGGRVDDE